jgi:hypothetical protein
VINLKKEYSMATGNTTNDQLRAIITALRQEAASIQIQARALSEDEKKRVEKINVALPLLEEALAKIGVQEG